MKISHVIYKANDLNKTIELFRGMWGTTWNTALNTILIML